MTATVAQAYAEVASLPTSADDVAQFLTLAGITGHQENPERCPLANFLRLRIPGLTKVQVENHAIQVDERWFDIDLEDQPLAFDAASIFIDLFDEGLYPQMIERRAIEARV